MKIPESAPDTLRSNYKSEKYFLWYINISKSLFSVVFGYHMKEKLSVFYIHTTLCSSKPITQNYWRQKICVCYCHRDEPTSTWRNRVSSTRYLLDRSSSWDTNSGYLYPAFSSFWGRAKFFSFLGRTQHTTSCRLLGSSSWSINVMVTLFRNGHGNIASYSPFITMMETDMWVSQPLGQQPLGLSNTFNL